MVYTNNVPQGNQTIANSQPQIQANFGFIQTDLQVEHIFNGNTPFGTQAEGTHIQASMPNQTVDPSSLPTGTAGIYYVKGGVPKFYNTAANFITMGANNMVPFSGSITIASNTAVPASVVPATNLSGYMSLYRSATAGGAFDNNVSVQTFFQNAVSNANFSIFSLGSNFPGLQWIGTQLYFVNTSLAGARTFYYAGWYILA
jgi:hypothetical protein